MICQKLNKKCIFFGKGVGHDEPKSVLNFQKIISRISKKQKTFLMTFELEKENKGLKRFFKNRI